MQKEIYTPMEQVLVKSALYVEALETRKAQVEALKLDLLLLEMESALGLQDGLPVEGAENV